MTSDKNANPITQWWKDVTSNPNPRRVARLMQDVKEIESHRLDIDATPSALVEALRAPAGTPRVIALGMLDMTLTAAIFPTGKANPDSESRVWASIHRRLPDWRAMNLPVDHIHREKLEPEVGGVTLSEPGRRPIITISSDLPHNIAPRAVMNAIKPRVFIPVAAAAAEGARWIGRGIRNHPIPALASAAVALTVVTVPASHPIVDRQQPDARPAPYAVPSVYVTIPSPGPTATVTATATVPSTPTVTSTPKPTPSKTFSPAVIVTPSPQPPVAEPTPSPEATPAKSTPTPSPTPVAEDTAPPDSVPSKQPAPSVPATAGLPVIPSEPVTLGDSCNGVVEVGATVGPLPPAKICVG